MSGLAEVQRDRDGNQFQLRPIACPTCGTRAERVVGLRGGRHQRDGLGIETRIVRCNRCGLIFPDPFPFPLAPQQLYGDPAKYFEAHDETVKIAVYRRLAQRIVKASGQPDPRTVDVGSGRGDFVHAAGLEGLSRVTGLEFSEAMIQYAQTRFRVALRRSSLEDLATTGEKFDVVVLNAVLEHVYDPDALIAAASAVTPARGVLYIDVPQEPNLLTMVGNVWNRLHRNPAVYNLSPTWPPYHVFGFNRRSLHVLLAKHGFEIEKISVWAAPEVPAGKTGGDHARAFVAKQINRVANLTGTAGNMYVWARRR